jgi:hypothetical protein
MTLEIREKLAALTVLAPKLNAATDEATQVVNAVEKFLEALSLGVSAETCFGTEVAPSGFDDDSRSETSFYLAYGRIAGKFRLHELERVTLRADDIPLPHREVLSQESTPWSSLGRELKLESFGALPKLLEEIVDRSTSLIAKAEQTSTAVREMLDGLEGELPGGRVHAEPKAANGLDDPVTRPQAPVSRRSRPKS